MLWSNCEKRRTFNAVALALLLLLPAGSATAEERRLAVEISDGTVDAASSTLRIEEGDRLTLEFRSDADATLHLHGYDLELELRAGETAAMVVEATLTGRFPLERHDPHGGSAHGVLLYLEVHPD